ncbi:hypothetical protein SCUCBS95973_000760 [Sporothrix curviconia]|uniref:WD repeat protein n=1 Tax=Sporothrix curviconia TaxID=1260050 RepID=A0ABP0AT36_9PEZI
MASKKVRQRISYVLEDARSLGHRLGVNGLDVDGENKILYSGGRDGVVCAWDLHLDKPTQAPAKPDESAPTVNGKKAEPAIRPTIQTAVSRAQTQAHTQWINDITLVQNNSALVTASSDLLVKVWRPRIDDNDDEPAILGKHADYVKCVASPGQQSTWVASGGLDRRICLWDLAGAGKILEIDVSGQENAEKGSVYALRANHNVLASGGPESTVRLWDPRAGGKNITKFVGHTDNVRAILVNDAGDTIMTASSDQTVKIWSVTAGRCMHTLTMHNDSVWALYSDAADLGVFYSGDRSGLVVKTDIRGNLNDVDGGLSVAVAQEHEGVSKVVASSGYIWTATSSSSINRWADIKTTSDEDAVAQPPRPFSPSGETIRPHSSSVSTAKGVPAPTPRVIPADIPAKSILRISNTAVFPAATPSSLGAGGADGAAAASPPAPVITRKGSEVATHATDAADSVEPVHRLPVETIEGNFGLVKHRLLNDRRRVLTLDTAGEVILWDIIACKKIRQFGKRHLEDVEPEVNTMEAVAPWCLVDVSSGQLTVVLEQYNCFDAEMYADELEKDGSSDGADPENKTVVEFREDQRINLGKWVLRYLFANLIDEELRRDEAYRAKLNESVEKRIQAVAAASKISMLDIGVSSPGTNGDSAQPTPTPGIGQATPLPASGILIPGATPQPGGEKEDYFSNAITSAEPTTPGAGLVRPGVTPGTETTPAATATADAATKEKEAAAAAATPATPGKGGRFGKMRMSFGTKKIGRSASTSVPEKPAGAAGVSDENKAASGGAAAGGGAAEDKSESASSHEKEVDDCFVGAVQRMHNDYEKQLAENPERMVASRMHPCQPDEAPVLRIPDKTKVIIQEELKGGSIELYRGTVGGLGQPRVVDKIERCAPMWLGEAILANSPAVKESTKISFLLLPYRDELPTLAAPDGSNRLNANRMLRVKKILAYVAEKLEPPPPPPAPMAIPAAAAALPTVPPVPEEAETADGDESGADSKAASDAAAEAEVATPIPVAAEPETEVLKPEEYLELYCNEQRLPHAMSLATVRAHIWKNSNDILLYYKSNGRKKLPTAAEVAAAAAASTNMVTAALTGAETGPPNREGEPTTLDAAPATPAAA